MKTLKDFLHFQSPLLSYTAPFQYGAMVTNGEDYIIHHYIDQQKMETFVSPFDSPYPKIDIDLKYFKILCEDSDDINLGDANGQTILHALCLYGNINAIKIALEAGADILAEDSSGFSVAHYCAMSDRADLLGFLDKSGADITKQALSTSRTPFHVAAICRSSGCIRYLIQTGININQVDNFGYSALWLAMYYHSDEVCQILTEHGAITKINEIDRITFVFRTFSKCPTYAKNVLDSYVNYCHYRRCSGIWLSNMVDGVSYELSDCTYSYLSCTGVSDNLISHPAIDAYISVAWDRFGRMHAGIEMAKCFMLCLLWTLHFCTDNNKSFDDGDYVRKIVVYVFTILYLMFRIYEKVSCTLKLMRSRRKYQEFELTTINREIDSLHPCMWNAIHSLVKEKREHSGTKIYSFIKHESVKAIIYILTIFILILDAFFAVNHKKNNHSYMMLKFIYNAVSSVILLSLWLSTFYMLKKIKLFSTFITSIFMLTGLIGKYAVMYLFFYIPMTCVFWVTLYEPYNGMLQNKTASYKLIDVMFKVYRMSYSDYTYSDGFNVAQKIGWPDWWNLIAVFWITVSTLILIRIFGGLVFNILSRPIRESSLISMRGRLMYICDIIVCMKRTERQIFMRYLELKCAPYLTDKYYSEEAENTNSASEMRSLRLQVKRLQSQVQIIRDYSRLEQSTSSDAVM